MAALSESMESAEGVSDLLEYVRQVKSAVIQSLETMNPGIAIQDTGHFNHSAVPDLVLRWPGRSAERPMYLRRSYAEIASTQDVQRLSEFAPVLLSLGPNRNDEDLTAVERMASIQSAAHPVLVTNAATVDLFTDRALEEASPIKGAVAAQVLPSGRGFLNEERAAPMLEGDGDLLPELADLLNEEAFQSISMIAAIVSAARSGDVSALEFEPRLFTMQEARDLLPWLLKTEDATTSPEFWRVLASKVSLKHLEGLADELADVEISSLAEQGARIWGAHRASLGLALRDADGDLVSEDGGWFMRGRLLTREVGDNAFRFATYGQAMKDRGNMSSATWGLVRPRLEDASLVQIALRGLERVIRIDAADAADVKGDADTILNSVEDVYYIDDLVLRYGPRDEDRQIRVLLGDQIVHNLGDASVRDLLRALSRVVSYRTPIEVPTEPESS